MNMARNLLSEAKFNRNVLRRIIVERKRRLWKVEKDPYAFNKVIEIKLLSEYITALQFFLIK